MNNSQDSNTFLEAIQLVVNRLSHAIRSPLGVALGVINDRQQGYQLDEQDYEDAFDALKRINALLELVKGLDFQTERKPEQILLSDIVTQVCSEIGGITFLSRCKIKDSAKLIFVDSERIKKALKIIFNYAFKNASDASCENSVGLCRLLCEKKDLCSEKEVIEISIAARNMKNTGFARTLLDIVKNDKRVETLLLISSHLIFVSEGMSVTLVHEQNSNWICRIET